MNKLISACAICATAVAAVAVPSALGAKTTKPVASTVTVSATPTTIDPTTTSVNVTGNVLANSSCRKNRTLHFFYVTNGVESSELATTPTPVTTRPNGDFTATLPPPPTTADGTTQVRAKVDETLRTFVVKGKKKGAGKGKKKGTVKKRKFDCLDGSGDGNILTVSDGLP